MPDQLPGVLLTRPEGYNDVLAGQLRSSGYRVLTRPLLVIAALVPNAESRRHAMDLDRYDVVVFVSRNAVRFGVSQLQAYWPQWPTKLTWCAVGSRTAEDLQNLDITAVWPKTPGGEGLVGLVDWRDVKQVLIVRGRGGLETLRESLEDQGIGVDYLEVYERSPRIWPRMRDEIASVGVVVITSGEAIEPLCRSLDEAELAKLSFVVPTQRVQAIAARRGLQNVVVADDFSDRGLMATIAAIPGSSAAADT